MEIANHEKRQAIHHSDGHKASSLLPTFSSAEFHTFANSNPAFVLGNPSFISQYPALNMINPQVSMSLLSPQLNYMNKHWIDPVKMNPYMINPYFAPKLKNDVPKGVNQIANSNHANWFPNFSPMYQVPMPEIHPQDDRRMVM